MVRFIICEDNKEFLMKIHNILTKVMMPYNFEYKISEFTEYNKDVHEIINKEGEQKVYILDIELGEISSYPQGVKENGAVFNHNNPWVVLACCVEKEPERAFDLYKRNAPSFIEEHSEIHRTEPYVYSQRIAGRSSKSYGQAKNSWLSGSATWSFVAISEGILGIQPEFDGLRVDPCLSKELGKVHVRRVFRNHTYEIDRENIGLEKSEIRVDGKKTEDNLIPIKDEEIIHVNIRL